MFSSRASRTSAIVLTMIVGGLAASSSCLAGWVYTSTNQSSGNRVRVFFQTPGGMLIPLGSVPTGGTGTGTGLGNQGAVTQESQGLVAESGEGREAAKQSDEDEGAGFGREDGAGFRELC